MGILQTLAAWRRAFSGGLLRHEDAPSDDASVSADATPTGNEALASAPMPAESFHLLCVSNNKFPNNSSPKSPYYLVKPNLR